MRISLVTNTATTVLGFETLPKVSGVLSKSMSQPEFLELDDTQIDCWNTLFGWRLQYKSADEDSKLQ